MTEIDWNDPPEKTEQKPVKKLDLTYQLRYLTGHIEYIENRQRELRQKIADMQKEKDDTLALLKRAKERHNG